MKSLYEEWLEKKGYMEQASYSPSIQIQREDYKPVWKDENGHEFLALSPQKIFEEAIEFAMTRCKKIDLS